VVAIEAHSSIKRIDSCSLNIHTQQPPVHTGTNKGPVGSVETLVYSCIFDQNIWSPKIRVAHRDDNLPQTFLQNTDYQTRVSGDIGDLLESFEGPRTLRYFTVLLMGVIGLLSVGSVLSSLYGIHWVENIGLALAENPMGLLNLAGILALIALVITIIPTILKYVD